MSEKIIHPLKDLTVSQELFDFDAAKTKVSDLLEKADEFFKSTNLTFLKEEPDYFSLPLGKLKSIEKKEYTDLRVRSVAIPPGLDATYLEYAKVLLNASEMIVDIQPNLLTPYSRWLATNINTPNNLLSARGGSVKGFKPNDIDGIYELMQPMFKKGSTSNVGKVGKHFSRLKDVSEVSKLNEEISKNLLLIDRKALLKKVDEIVHYLEILFDRLTDEHATPVSPEVGKMLSKLTYTVAREMEFMGVVFYNHKAFNVAFEQVIEKL